MDNSSGFINYHLNTHLKEHYRTCKQSRSRSYMENDSAHAEQKNRMHVRDLFERYRIDDACTICAAVISYHVQILRERMLRTERQKFWRIYAEAQTPVERLLKHEKVFPEKKEGLEKQNEKTVCFELVEASCNIL